MYKAHTQVRDSLYTSYFDMAPAAAAATRCCYELLLLLLLLLQIYPYFVGHIHSGGHIFCSMRTHTQQYEDMYSSMRTYTYPHCYMCSQRTALRRDWVASLEKWIDEMDRCVCVCVCARARARARESRCQALPPDIPHARTHTPVTH